MLATLYVLMGVSRPYLLFKLSVYICLNRSNKLILSFYEICVRVMKT